MHTPSGLLLHHCGPQVLHTKRTTGHQASPKVRGNILQACPRCGGAKAVTPDMTHRRQITRGGCFQIRRSKTLLSLSATTPFFSQLTGRSGVFWQKWETAGKGKSWMGAMSMQVSVPLGTSGWFYLWGRIRQTGRAVGVSWVEWRSTSLISISHYYSVKISGLPVLPALTLSAFHDPGGTRLEVPADSHSQPPAPSSLAPPRSPHSLPSQESWAFGWELSSKRKWAVGRHDLCLWLHPGLEPKRTDPPLKCPLGKFPPPP